MSLHPVALSARGHLRALAVALVLGAVAAVVPAGPADAARRPPVRAAFFGVHHLGLHADGALGWPQTPVGSVRLWDNGVSWRELEAAPGVFDWTRLDALVAKARANGATVLLVLGQTPAFHSTRPAAVSRYGPGASAMPTKAAWVRYVKAVASRNRTVWGGAATLQVWNEANVPGYWSGTPKQMATLTAWTDAALRAVDPAAQLVAPAMVTRLIGQRAWIRTFYGQRVGGSNVSRYVDALSFQLYPATRGTPEASMKLLAAVRAVLARQRISKPIWNTEVNYGLVGGATAGSAVAQLGTDRQVGNVLRTFVLNAQNRVSRVYWYSWDLLGMSNTRMVETDRITLTPAGRAFGTARAWLQGSRPAGCTRARNGTWTCTFTTGTQTRRVVWNPGGATRYAVPSGRTSMTTWSSTSATRTTTSRVSVGVVPVLFTTPR
jgi:hypothetical protein